MAYDCVDFFNFTDTGLNKGDTVYLHNDNLDFTHIYFAFRFPVALIPTFYNDNHRLAFSHN